MSFTDLNKMPQTELIPGFHVRFVHSDTMTIAYWQIEKGSALQDHNHPHEQILSLLEGEFELTVDGVPHHLTPGNVFVLPGGVSHGGKALTDCRIIDVFHPVREDYR